MAAGKHRLVTHTGPCSPECYEPPPLSIRFESMIIEAKEVKPRVTLTVEARSPEELGCRLKSILNALYPWYTLDPLGLYPHQRRFLEAPVHITPPCYVPPECGWGRQQGTATPVDEKMFAGLPPEVARESTRKAGVNLIDWSTVPAHPGSDFIFASPPPPEHRLPGYTAEGLKISQSDAEEPSFQIGVDVARHGESFTTIQGEGNPPRDVIITDGNVYGAGTLTTDASGNITPSSDEEQKDVVPGGFTVAAPEGDEPVTYVDDIGLIVREEMGGAVEVSYDRRKYRIEPVRDRCTEDREVFRLVPKEGVGGK